MTNKTIIFTEQAPKPIGTYSQAVQVGNLVFISGQIAIDPNTNQLDNNSIEAEIIRVFDNLQAICEAARANINNVVKLNLYLTDLSNFSVVNQIMAQYFNEPYPARAVVEVSALPKGVRFEADAVLQVI